MTLNSFFANYEYKHGFLQLLKVNVAYDFFQGYVFTGNDSNSFWGEKQRVDV